jgi:hypothetical protein
VGEGDINVYLLIFISPIHIYTVVLYIAQAGTGSPTLLMIFQPAEAKDSATKYCIFYHDFLDQANKLLFCQRVKKTKILIIFCL